MFDVKFYVFQKKNNSTKRPTDDNINTTMSMQANEDFDILHPLLKVRSSITSAPNYNYAYIPSLDRYYWVRSWNCKNGLWYAQLDCDYLATWKGTIGSSSQYVLRSSAECDPLVVDMKYPTKAGAQVVFNQADKVFKATTNPGEMCYIVGLIGPDDSGVNYYAFNYFSIQTFMSYLLETDITKPGYMQTVMTKLGLNLESEVKAVINPIQYITSFYALPIMYRSKNLYTVLQGSRPGDEIKVGQGYVDMSSSGTAASDYKLLSKWTTSFDERFTYPVHPQADANTAYLKASPYSQYYLIAPPFPMIQWERNSLSDTIQLIYNLSLDVRTGHATLTIAEQQTAGGDFFQITKLSTTMGVNLPLSQVVAPGTSALSLVGTAANVAASVLTGNYAGAVGAATGAIDSAIKNKVPKATTMSSVGSLDQIEVFRNWGVQAEFNIIVDTDNADLGRPLCKTRQLNTIPGYILINNPHVEVEGFPEEKGVIEAYMAEGMFFE